MLTHDAIDLPGYQITEQLYSGSRTLVYRAVQQADQQPVVIKLLKHEQPSFNELVQFRNQYTIAKNLNASGIVKLYSLQPYRNGYALVMEDCGGISLRHYTKGRSLPLESFFAIALQLVEILQPLHQQGVIHKDIKPANILIYPDSTYPERQQVKLLDFSIASLLPRETQSIQSPNVLEGTLAYLSPEQTGRMNRGIDYRSDFYSLGVTFYELLTGQLPFQTAEPMELVHCHIAKQPPALGDRHPELPSMLGAIVHKLMAKNAEDRYQSETGLKHDLIKCQEQWQAAEQSTLFTLGQRDVSDRFLIPETLYGREQEVETLLQAFERVTKGASELLLVAGFSGIGKTAVVHEVQKPIVRCNGYFIKGKYDQFQRDLPFSAFVQAFRNLIRQLLSESDAQLAQFQRQLLAVVGEHGQVLIEMIPELEQLIGKQLPAAELSGNAAQNRFNRLFQQFMGVFATREHPLVLFLDDLQWADSASLGLMKRLMAGSEQGYLFIIGAYRDNEVFPAHPLMLALADIASEATVSTLTLKPLSQPDVNQLIAATLSCPIDRSLPLTEVIYLKTKGNPFFTTQFFKSLHEEDYITFDRQAGYWQCEMTAVRSLSITDDVVAFMALQLQKLPAATQEMLKLAACMGAQFDLETLAIVSQQAAATVASALWKALQDGLLLPINEVYKFYQSATPNPQTANLTALNCAYRFLHDRVQQAAYSLIPDDQKQSTHLQVGRLLQQATPASEREEKLFAIVNHLNKGAALIDDEREQQALVQLNLAAGQKAKGATAYVAALHYFNTGIALLRDDRWHQYYELTLALYEGAANAAYLSTDFEQMERLAQVVLIQARSWLDRVNIYTIQIQACIAQNRQLEALRLAREILKPLGVHLPEHPTQADSGRGLQQTQTALSDRSIESLQSLPEMTVPESKAAMVILSSIISAAYQADPNLLPLIILAHIDLSVQYGNAPESTYGYVMYGTMQISVLSELNAGYRFGRLGMNLLQSIHAPTMAAKTLFGFNNSVSHWKEPAKDTLSGYLQAYSKGLEIGDIQYAALSLLSYGYTAYFSGQELSSLRRDMEAHRQVMQQLRQDAYLHKQSIYYQSVLNLLEVGAEPDRLHSEHYDEAEMIPLHLKTNDVIGLFQIYFSKLLLSYLFQRYEQARENARLTEQYLGAATGLLHIPLFFFYDALVQLAVYPTVSETEQMSILDRVAAHQAKLKEWAIHAPSNQAHRWALVAAEHCRVLGQKADAIDLYDRAIAGANENEYIQEAAIANELAAKFYLAWHKERIAQAYLIEAYYSYTRWGAKAKVADLESRYPQLLAPILQQVRSVSLSETVFPFDTVSSTSSSNSISDALDLTTILKASQTLSSEIELSKLLSTLLQLMLENAGADKCVLLLRNCLQDDTRLQDNTSNQPLLVEGLATAGADPIVLQRLPLEESQDIPLKLVYCVKNHLKPVVLLDATTQTEFMTDPYFQQHQPKSILCNPILHQGELLGIVYLENHWTIGAFTTDRIHILNALCTQATISLENSRLFKQAQDYAESLEQFIQSQELLVEVVSDIRRSLDVDTIFAVVTQRVREILHADRVGIYQFAADAEFNTGAIVAEAVLPGFPSALQVKVEDYCFGERYAAFYQQGRVHAVADMTQTEIQACYRQTLEQFGVKANLAAPILWRGELWGLLCVHQCSQPRDWSTEAIQFTKQIAVQLSVALEQAQLLSQTHKQAQQLEHTLQNLQQTQLQMIQQEKMSALGNLVAGVAHEINNPIGFISGNLNETQQTMQDLVAHLNLYRSQASVAAIANHAEEIDLAYLLEDLPKMVNSMKLGVDRIKGISTSLRTFSRADQNHPVIANLHDGIDSTLLILKHRLKANETRPAIVVVTNYGQIPAIECFPGQLNQVFMNILANAIDALEEKMQSRTARSVDDMENGSQSDTLEASAPLNQIAIHTRLADAQTVIIQIRDNGPGMSDAIKQQVFDHLFTTKAVGKGTGLGLAIAHQIVVEKHGGTINVNSNPGKGTEFVLTLPVQAPKRFDKQVESNIGVTENSH